MNCKCSVGQIVLATANVLKMLILSLFFPEYSFKKKF